MTGINFSVIIQMMFDFGFLGEASIILSVITTAAFVLTAWMTVSFKKKASWLAAAGFLLLACWAATSSLGRGDTLVLIGSLLIAVAVISEQISLSHQIRAVKPAKEEVDRKVTAILNQPGMAEKPDMMNDAISDDLEPDEPASVSSDAKPTQAVGAKRPIQLNTGLRSEPLIKLPAERRKKARLVFNVLVGFMVLALVGWGSYTVAKKVLMAKDDFGILTSPAAEVTTTIPAATETPAEETKATPTPTVSSTPEASPQAMVTVKETETGYLNVREGASTATAIIKQIKPGESYQLLEENEDGTWIKLQIDDNTAGWVNAKYIEK